MRFVRALLIAIAPILTIGCGMDSATPPMPSAGAAIQGMVHGGQQPVSGAHVYLFAAGPNTGTPSASISLLNAGSGIAADSIGNYVTTDDTGSFSITGDYTCTANQQVYIAAFGGNTGGGDNNPASGLLGVVGQCPVSGNFAGADPFVVINEVTTVAAAYSIGAFADDATHVSYTSSAAALTGISNAFAGAGNLVDISTGQTRATTPAGNGTVPQAEINTLGNILASCVNSLGVVSGPTNPTTCYTLFNAATNDGTPTGVVPTDTATAAINIAHNQTANTATLMLLASGVPVFVPVLQSTPNDFSLPIAFTGGGINAPYGIAADVGGNLWITNLGCNCVSEFSPLGAPISPATGYTGGGLNQPQYLTIGTDDSVWIANFGDNHLVHLANDGTALSPSTGIGTSLNVISSITSSPNGNVIAVGAFSSSGAVFSSGGTVLFPFPSASVFQPTGVGVDAANNIFVLNSFNKTVTKLDASGNVLSPQGGYPIPGLTAPTGIAVDPTGNVWVSHKGQINGAGTAYVPNTGALFELSNAGAVLSPSNGYMDGSLNFPLGLLIGRNGDPVVMNTGDNGTCELKIFAPDSPPGSPPTDCSQGPSTDTSFTPQTGVADTSGNLWIPSNTENRVTQFVGFISYRGQGYLYF